MRKLAEAVQAAHEASVIHRDLKPANVLLTADGSLKVTDFGLAKKLDEAGRTQEGSTMGTPSYMAPEQAAGAKDVGPPADVYALGAILYECLTGRPPFRAATAFDTILQVVGQEPVPVRQLNAKVPADLETVCLKCLSKEPARRYGSAKELGDDLGRFLAGEPIRARPVGAVGRAAKWARRNPAVAALAATVFVALAAGTTVSTLFALDAREQAEEAREQKKNAEESAAVAKRNEEAAKRSEARAKEQERETAKALEEVETTLVDGLLRPIGRSAPEYDNQGRNGHRLDPSEQEVLLKLGSVRSDPARLRLIESGLDEPGTAERIGQRADWTIQAAVGLNRDRRRQVEAMVARGIRQRKQEEVALACARLGLELNCREENWAGHAAEALVAALGKTTDPKSISNLTHGLGVVSEKLEPTEAARHAGKAAETLSTAMSKATDPSALSYLARGLDAVCKQLNPGEAERHAGKAAEALAAAMTKATDPFAQHNLAEALKAVSGRLEPKEANRHAGKAAEALAAAMSKVTDPAALDRLAGALEAVSERLDAKVAGKAAEALAAPMSRATGSRILLNLARVQKAVSARLDTREATGHSGKAAEALVASMSKSSQSDISYEASGQRDYLASSTTDLVRLLSHPLCAGEAQRAVLEVLGQRHKRHFRNAWHFIDWADSNGVDWIAEAGLDAPRR